MILKFSDLKGNLVLIFPLNRQQIAEWPTSNHRATCYYTVDIELFLIFNFPLWSVKLLYQFKTPWDHHLIAILEFIYNQVNGYISLLDKTKGVIFIVDKTFWVFEVLDLISSTRFSSRKDTQSLKSARYIFPFNSRTRTNAHTHIEQLQSAIRFLI